MSTISLAICLAALSASVAAFVDVRTRRIPNWLTAGMVVLGIAVNLGQAGPEGGISALLGAVLGLAMLFPFYAIRAIGAGDVKLLAALGAILGPVVLLSVALYGALVGGVVAALMLARRGRLGLAVSEMFVQHTLPSRSGVTAPYGLAIASGVYLTLLLPRVVG